MQDVTDNNAKFTKSFARPLIILAAILAIGGVAVYSFREFSQAQVESNTIPSVPEIKTVTAFRTQFLQAVFQKLAHNKI